MNGLRALRAGQQLAGGVTRVHNPRVYVDTTQADGRASYDGVSRTSGLQSDMNLGPFRAEEPN